MTEAELAELSIESWSNVISVLTLFITVMSVYLIVAYAAGRHLTKQQVVLINFLYGVFTALGVFAAYRFSKAAVEYGRLSIELSTQRTEGPIEVMPIILAVVLVPMLAGCYKFMWDIRRRKKA